MKLSAKDLLILLGIVVAVIITLTTLVFSDQTAFKKAELPPVKKTSLQQLPVDAFHKFLKKATLDITPSL
jgi:hypothetical protein